MRAEPMQVHSTASFYIDDGSKINVTKRDDARYLLARENGREIGTANSFFKMHHDKRTFVIAMGFSYNTALGAVNYPGKFIQYKLADAVTEELRSAMERMEIESGKETAPQTSI